MRPNGNKLPSLAPGGRFTTVTGTSFATPVIAGIAGALAARWPDADPFELQVMLRLMADDNGMAGARPAYLANCASMKASCLLLRSKSRRRRL